MFGYNKNNGAAKKVMNPIEANQQGKVQVLMSYVQLFLDEDIFPFCAHMIILSGGYVS